uniref:Uncharacterized protein n=1 Tax=Arundo donax TaxID=35708 RepID=A0A0A9H2M4_ARUDO
MQVIHCFSSLAIRFRATFFSKLISNSRIARELAQQQISIRNQQIRATSLTHTPLVQFSRVKNDTEFPRYSELNPMTCLQVERFVMLEKYS